MLSEREGRPEGRRRAGVAQPLVGAVAAVVGPVADVGLEHAAAVVAAEVFWRAGRRAAAGRLVRQVLAVRRAVAVPRVRDADARRLALELLLGLALVRRQRRAARLVAAVVAVRDAVALVRFLYDTDITGTCI